MFRETPEKGPAASALKARRRRKPTFIDEPIQWHLRTSRYDRCPWCGLQKLVTRGARKRVCESCEGAYEISVSPDTWMHAKLGVRPCLSAECVRSQHPLYYPVDKNDCYTLEEAQLRSNEGRAVLGVQHSNRFDTGEVYWHREGHLPELRDGTRVCEGGSEFHKWLRGLRKLEVWTPVDPLCAMEVIAKAATDPMSAIVGS